MPVDGASAYGARVSPCTSTPSSPNSWMSAAVTRDQGARNEEVGRIDRAARADVPQRVDDALIGEDSVRDDQVALERVQFVRHGALAGRDR